MKRQEIDKQLEEKIFASGVNRSGISFAAMQLKMKEIVNQVRNGDLTSIVNAQGERMIFSPTESGCEVVTELHSGWRKVVGFNEDGMMTFSIFDGRWKESPKVPTKYQKMVSKIKAEIKEVFKENRWEENRWGHLILQEEEKTFRIRFRPRVVRHEVKTSSGDWKRIGSAKYEDLSVVEKDGMLEVLGFCSIWR